MEHNPSSLLPPQTPENPELQPQSEEQQHQEIITVPPKPLPLPLASLTLSLSLSLFSSLLPPSLSSFPTNIKIPSQISSLSLSSPTSTPNSKNPRAAKAARSPVLSPLFTPVPRRRPSDPSGAAAARRCTVVWFRADLRVHDNEALTAASNESLSLLPVYLFDPRDYGKSSSGFDKTGPYRAAFLLESVADLRASLRSRGSDLVVRVGRPEAVLVELARAVGADAIYAHREVSHDEVHAEERVGKAMEEEGVEVKYFWGSTLYHIDDLPFELEQMPLNYGGFRERVQGLAVRKTIEALDQIKGLPSRGDVEPGDIPSLLDLGLNPAPTTSQIFQHTVIIANQCACFGSVLTLLSYAAPKRVVLEHTFVTIDATRILESSYDFSMVDANSMVFLFKYAPDGAKMLRIGSEMPFEAIDHSDTSSWVDGKPAVNASLKGGEMEALERLKRFASECRVQPGKGNKDGRDNSLYGANFSCKISPWLAMGCLSPRLMFGELKKTTSRTISASTQRNGAAVDNGLKWLMFELLWRDFFRFITKKYSSNKRKTEAVPATACTGALV